MRRIASVSPSETSAADTSVGVVSPRNFSKDMFSSWRKLANETLGDDRRVFTVRINRQVHGTHSFHGDPIR